MNNFKQLHLTFAGQIETVSTASMLPTQGIVEGAIRYIEDTDTITIWDGSAWVGPTFDSLTVNNLTVNNIAYVNANVVEIGDNIITLNSDVVGTPTEDSGIEINRGSSPNAYILWDETEEVWKAGIAGDMGRFPSTAPAFMYTRSGSVTTGTWLLNSGIPSNIAGVPVAIPAAKVERIFVDSSSQSTFSIGLYEHDHVSYTLLGTVSVTADYGDEYITNLPITVGKKLAVKLDSGSASNLVVGLQIKG
jgi:hypothetical protein